MAPHFEIESGRDAGEPNDYGFEHSSNGEEAIEMHKKAEGWAERNGVIIREYQDLGGLPCRHLPNTYGETVAPNQT